MYNIKMLQLKRKEYFEFQIRDEHGLSNDFNGRV